MAGGHGMERWGSLGAVAILSAVGATGAGATFGQEAKFFSKWSFQSSGTFVATVVVQGSLDGTVWFTIGDVSTSGTIVTYGFPLFAIRGNVTAYTSGSVTVKAMASE